MSTASHAASGHLSLGGLMSRILFILVLWAGLVYGTLHYVGYVIPKQYQLNQARSEAAEAEAKALANPEPVAPVAAPAAASAAPAASASAPATATPAMAATPAPTATSTPAAPAASAGSAIPAPAAASAAATPVPAAGSATPAAPANKKLPKDVLLAGFNRTALTNVARFYSIVISFFCVGAIILQVFKYKHIEEEPAH